MICRSISLFDVHAARSLCPDRRLPDAAEASLDVARSVREAGSASKSPTPPLVAMNRTLGDVPRHGGWNSTAVRNKADAFTLVARDKRGWIEVFPCSSWR